MQFDRPTTIDEAYETACALHQAGRLQEAEPLYRSILDKRRDHAGALNNLGLILLGQGKPEEAAERLRAALKRNPRSAEAHGNLGGALLALDDDRGAADHLEQAIALKPDYFKAYNNLGIALIGLGRCEDAVARLEAALAQRDDIADLHHTLGLALETLGRVPEARQAFERAIELARGRPRFYRSLAECKRFTDEDPHLPAMERLAKDMTRLPLDERIHLHCALGKAYDDLGRHEEAFRHILDGNALVRQRIVYDERASLDMFERIETVFTADLMRQRQGVGHPSEAPVFIFGVPRSGSTLIEQILASHRQIFGGGEIENFRNIVAKFDERPGASDIFPEAVRTMSDAELARLGAAYMESIAPRAGDARRFTDKLPSNFLFAGLIHLALPNARMIHIRRDPVDTCFSWFSKIFVGGQPHSYDLGELGRYYRAYDGLMAHWRSVLPTGTMLELRYEDIVADPGAVARTAVAHCGLDWDEACLAFHETERAVATPSRNQVREPVYKTAIGRARPYRMMMQPLLMALGPDLAGEAGPRG